MPPSFNVYIDEAGDEGFVFGPDRQGSSRWFVLAAVVTRHSCDLATVKLVDTLRASFNWNRRPLHFRKLKHEHRLPYIDLIARAEVRVLAVAIHKESLPDRERFQRRSVLYHHAARLLLERAPWCCRHDRQQSDGDGTATITFSNRGCTSYADLREYFALLKRESEVGDVRIDWDVIRPAAVRSLNHESSMGLQIADACASAFYYAFQKSPQGFNEPRYASMLRPVVFALHGSRIGNGLVVVPREAIAPSASHLAWIQEGYLD